MAILGDKVEDGFVELENIKTGEKKGCFARRIIKNVLIEKINLGMQILDLFFC